MPRINEFIQKIIKNYTSKLLNKDRKQHPEFFIPSVYAVISCIWILSTDFRNIKVLTIAEILKGWFFIFLTTFLLYVLVRSAISRIRRAEVKLQDSYTELQQTYGKLEEAHEELKLSEEELRMQFDDLMASREALRISEERYKLAVEGANDSIWEWDVTGTNCFRFSRMKEILGYDRNSIDMTIEELISITHPEDVQMMGKRLNDSLHNLNDGFHFDFRAIDIDGNIKIISFRGKQIVDKNKKVIKLVGSSTDVTEFRKINELKTKYELLSKSSRDIILFINYDGSIMDANLSAVNTYGYTYEELLITNLKDLRSSKNISDFFEQFEKAKKEGIMFETEHIRKDGTCFPVEVSSQTAVCDGQTIIVSIIRDITERKNSESELIRLANYDSLTNTPNRAYLFRHMKAMIEQSENSGHMFSVITFDVDKFKLINDTHGHEIGDIVLVQITNRIKKLLQTDYFFARLGGDEFVIIQPNVTSKEDCEKLASLIIRECEKPLVCNDLELVVSLSIGASLYPIHAESKEALMRLSDQAMYTAKAKGGKSFCFSGLD